MPMQEPFIYFFNNRYFLLASLVGFEPTRQRYIASQKPNTLPTELSGRPICKRKVLQWSLRYSFGSRKLQLDYIFLQDSADKHIPSKTSRSVSSVPWITPEIRRKIRKKNETYAKAERTGSAKIRSKFETLRREIKADIRKQHDPYVNNLVGDVKANPRDFYRYINS